MALWRKKSTPPPPPPSGPGGPPSAGGRADERVYDDPPTRFLSGDPLQDRRQVRVLLDAIARVSESRDLESLLEHVVDSAVSTTGAEQGLLVLLDDEGRQTVRVARRLDPGGAGALAVEGPVKYSTSVVARVLADDEPLRTTVDNEAEARELGTSVFDLKLRAVMCVPLTPGRDHPSRSHLRGALYVDSKAATRSFTDEDLALFSALAQHIAIALENAHLNLEALEKVRLERSLEIASEIQEGLMPKAPPEIDGYELFGWYRPAEHATGDFYDFVVTRDGRLAVVVGDVTGHGIGPALVTATAQASLRSYAKILGDPGEVVTQLNQDLCERLDDGMFLTLFVAFLAPDGQVHYVNAGQTPPLLWRKQGGAIQALAGTGPALGMMDDFEYQSEGPIALEAGDRLILLTDGLVEARHRDRPDRLFGESGVRATLSELLLSDPSAQALTEGLVQGVLEFAGGRREDDMTVVTVRRRAT